MAVSSPFVHLPHQMDRSLGGRLVEDLNGFGSRFGAEQVGVEDIVRLEVVPQLGEAADIALGCNRTKQTVKSMIVSLRWLLECLKQLEHARCFGRRCRPFLIREKEERLLALIRTT